MTLPANMDIALYLNISFYAMLGLGLFFGFLRGFKKELFAFVTTVLFYVAFFLTINMAVQFIWTLQIPQLGGWLSGFLPELSGITSLSQALPLVISSRLGEVLGAMTTNEQLLLLADGLGIFVLKLVWTLLYFTIIFVVYKLLCGILRALFMPRRKLDEKYASKNRGLGALFGLLGGAVSVFVTLILLGGFMSIAASMVSFLPESEPDPEEIVLSMPRQEMRELSYSLIPLAEETPLLPPEAMESVAMITDFVQAYQNNWIVQFASQLTMPDDRGEEMELSLYLFDEVLSFDYQANALDPDSPIVQVSLRKELSVFAEIAGMAIDSGLVENPDLGNLTTEQIVAVFDKLAQSDLVTSLLPLGIEFAAEYSDIDIELPREQLYAMDWKGELENLGVIAATLYEIADLAGAFEPEGFDYETITLDGQTIRDFFGVVSESQLITLAAAVAVTPLIEMAGVQAIVVVPADMDWPAEFIAIGTVLGEILDAGITIGDVTSANYVVILQAVAGVDFELILNSKIMTHTLINILSGNAGIAELSLIKVPAGTIWLDQYDNEGHLIANGELRNILLALEALLSIAAESEIDFQTIGQNPSQLLSVIGDLNMDDVDTIFGSAVLVATLSDLLISQDLGGFELIIPDTVLDENGYILKTEFVKLVGSAKVLSANLACDVEDTSCQETGIDINKALTLGETDLDTLLDSDILSATVGHLLYTMTGGEGEESILVVPDEALGDVYQKQVFVACVDRSEIKRIFKAIRTLGIDSMDDIENLGPSTLNEIDTEDNPATTEVDESLEIGDLVASIVIRATITKLLKSMDLGTTVIVVPDAGLEAGKTYLSSQELENTVRAIKLIIHFNTCDLEVDPDCQEVDFDIAAVLNLSDPEIDTLLASSVIRGTIGKYLLEMEDVLVVPDSVQETILVDGVGIAVVEELEIRAIFKAVRALGISNFEEVDFGPSILNNLSLEDDPATPEDESDELDQAKLDDLFGSIVLRATLTDLLTSMELGGTVLVVPDAALEAGQNYLTVAELNGAVKAMKLVITTQTCDLEIDPDCQEVTFEVSTVLDLSDSEIDTLMASQIIRGTLGKYLLDMPEVLTVPGSVTETVIVETAPVTVVKETEIRALLKAVRALGMENFEDVSFNASIINDLSLENDPATPEDESKQLDETKLDDLFGSAILRATVTDLLTDQNLGETSLLVPDTAKNAEGYLTQNELKAVARSLKLVIHTQTCDLEVDPDCVEVEFAMDSVLSMTDPEITTLLASEVIAATIGSYVHDIDSLVIPSTVIVSVSVDGIGQTVVQTDEIHLMLSAVSVLGFTSFDGFSFDATVIRQLALEDDPHTIPDESADIDEDKLQTLFDSLVIRATMSDMMMDMAEGEGAFIVIPQYELDEVALAQGAAVQETIGGVVCITEAELGDVLRAIFYLDIEDFDTIDEEIDLDLILAHLDVILRSSILQSSITQQLLDTEEGAAGSFLIPDHDEEGTQILFTIASSPFLTTEELEATFRALKVLGLNDLTEFSGSVDLAHVGEGNNAQILVASAIIQATVSAQVNDLDAAGTILVPDLDVDGLTPIRKTFHPGEADEIRYIAKTELERLLLALDVLGLTDDVSSFGGNIDLKPLYDNEPDQIILLASAIIHATITDQILGMGANLTVPETDVTGTVDLIVSVAGTDFLDEEEIKALINALGVLYPDGIQMDGFAGDFDLATLYDQTAKQDKLLLSASIHATISEQILGLGASLLIPDTDVTGTETIRITQGLTTFVWKDEIKSLINALGVLYPDGIQMDGFAGDFDLVSLYDDSDQQDKLMLSASIHATISDQILGMGGALLVPDTDVTGLETIRIVQGATTFVWKQEIKDLINAIGVLFPEGVLLDGFTGNFALEKLYDDEIKQNKLLESASIHATISDQILGLGAALSVPDTDVTGTETIRITQGTTPFVWGEEIKALINALGVLYPDGIALDGFQGNFDLSTLYDDSAKQNKLLLSASIHATISDQILGMAALTVPTTDVNGLHSIQIPQGLTIFVWKDEVKALIDAIGVLFPAGIELDAFSGTFNLADLYDDAEKQDKLLLSASIHATISDQILGLAALTVPQTAYDGVTTLQIAAGGVLFVRNNEIKNLINALGVLFPAGIDLDSFDGSINLASLYDNEANQNKLLLSSAIHATISHQILDIDDAFLLVPDTDVNGTLDIQIPIDGTTYLLDSEIKNLINALKLIGFGDGNLSGYNGNISLAQLIESTVPPILTQAQATANQNKLLLSAIMQATIAKTLLDLPDDVLIIPEDDENGSAIRIAFDVVFLTNAEIRALIDGFGKMGFSDLDNFPASLSSSQFFANRDVLLLSASMQATISDKMLHGTGGVLIVPDAYRIDGGNCTLILRTEIDGIMDVLDELDLENFGAMSFQPATIFRMEPAELLATGSMRATISKTLLDEAADETVADGYAGLIVPRSTRETILVATLDFTQIEQSELLALLTSLKMLDVTDFGADFSPAKIMEMDETELNEFLASGSIHNTMNKMVKGNSNLIVPALCEFTMYPASAHPILTVITKAELVDFIQAVQKIGSGDFTTISFDAGTLAAIQGMTEADREVVLESYIVRATITDSIETLVAAKNAQYLMDMTPEFCFNLDTEDYEIGYDGTVLTFLDSVDIFKFLNNDHSIID